MPDAPGSRTTPVLAHLLDDYPDHVAARLVRAGRVLVDGALILEPRAAVALDARVEVTA